MRHDGGDSSHNYVPMTTRHLALRQRRHRHRHTDREAFTHRHTLTYRGLHKDTPPPPHTRPHAYTQHLHTHNTYIHTTLTYTHLHTHNTYIHTKTCMHTNTVSRTTTTTPTPHRTHHHPLERRESRAEAESNRGPSVYA